MRQKALRTSQWAKSPKIQSEGVRFFYFGTQCHVVKNTLLQTGNFRQFSPRTSFSGGTLVVFTSSKKK